MSAAEAYQNIKVLKEIPADQLVPAMQFITYSLGVECSYCHVEGALEKDDKKPKQTARNWNGGMSRWARLPNGSSVASGITPISPARARANGWF